MLSKTGPCVLLATLCFATSARAQSDANRAAAVALFDEAQRLRSEGQTAAACPKLAESYRLDPQLGALLHLADCYEKSGKLASAWGAWRDAAEVAQKRNDEREALARAHATTLEPKLAKLVLDVPSTSEAQGLEIRRDGALVSRPLWGTPVPVDVGEHVIEASAPGRQKLVAKVVVAKDGVVETYSLSPLEDAPAEAPAKAAMPPGSASQAATGDTAEQGDAGRGSPSTLVWIAGGLGVLALGSGIYFELSKGSKDDDRQAICPSGKGCTLDDKQRIDALTDEMRTAATWETVSFVAAGAFLAGAATLYFIGSSPERKPAAKSFVVAPSGGPNALGVVGMGWW